MIEMVYRGTSKDGKGKERTGLPKNIRQIGDAGSDKRVYIEDYVITFLEKTGCAVLLGEVWQNENMKCLFADGAVEIAEGEPNDDMWEKIYREMKQYFPGREVIGWAKKMEEPEEEPDEKLFDLHREQFPGEDRLLFLYDSEENASVFLTENTGIRKQSGYYIYYEKNEQMQSYMVKENEGQSVEAESKNQDGAIQNFRRRIAKKQQDAQNVEQEQKSKTPTMVRFLYGASMFLVLTILVSRSLVNGIAAPFRLPRRKRGHIRAFLHCAQPVSVAGPVLPELKAVAHIVRQRFLFHGQGREPRLLCRPHRVI